MDSLLEGMQLPVDEKEILKVKAQIWQRVVGEIQASNASQREAANLLGVSQPRVCNLMNGKLDLFSVDTLIGFLARCGRRLVVVTSQIDKATHSEVFLTPFVDEDNLGDEQDAYELRIEKQLAALPETTLNPQQIEKARAELEEARQEARNLRILELIGDASLVLVRRDQKLVAVVDGFDHEITAGNDWL